MKKVLMVLAYLLFPIVATLIASGFGSVLITIAAFIVSIIVELVILRADVLMLLGSFNYQKDREKGLKFMELSMKTGKMRSKSQLLYAYLLIRNGFLDEAESIINKTTYLGKNILKPADFKTADFNMALITWKRGNLNDAIMQMEELYSEGYLNSNLYGSLGYFYIANNEIDKAIEFSKEGAEYNPDDLITLDNLGQAYIAAGNLDEAEEIYDRIFEKEPQFIEPFYNYATLLEKHGELTDAKECYEKALEYDEKFLSTVTHDMVRDAISRVDEILNIGKQE